MASPPPLLSDAFLCKFKEAVKDIQPIAFLDALHKVSFLPNSKEVLSQFVDTLISAKKTASAVLPDASLPPRKKIGVMTPAKRKQLFLEDFARRVHEFAKDPETFSSLAPPTLLTFTDINALIQVKNIERLAETFAQAEKAEQVGNIIVFDSLLTRALILHGAWTLGKEDYDKFLAVYKTQTGKSISERTSQRSRALLTTLFFPYPRLRHLGRFISWTAFGDYCEEILRYFKANPLLAQLFADNSFDIDLGFYKQEHLPVFEQVDELSVLKGFYWGYDYALVDQMEDAPIDEDPALKESIERYQNLPPEQTFVDDNGEEAMATMTLV